MAPRRLPHDFNVSATYPLYAIDPAQDRAWVLHFDREDYRRASFLDQRALHRQISGWTVSGAELAAARAPAPPLSRLRWIFHIGHCGSSLVSRLLDLIPGTLGLREPLPLLTLAHESRAADHPWWPTVRTLLARGFEDTQAVVVKPTSIVTNVALPLLQGTGPACFLWVDLRTWLSTLLRDADLVSAVLATEPLRLAGMPALAEADTAPARLARAWLIEQLRWRELGNRVERGRLLDVDFAQVVAAPAAATARIAAHFALVVPDDWAEQIDASGLLTRYAKDASQVFDANTRRRELAASADQHAGAITEGLRWAQREIDRLEVPALALRLQPAP
ncbi:hypothetical protein [Lysobacter solisilvae (ex Woo and Kim 2020)]|uniref:Sulfotransferase family protein n=1 Tax=Agrilutibacter terrestris TaxID=2865112 RepID=A0A7H0FZH2_9GAMM|nr:hypothetical protein [Lysobacter terrestris]QNP41438.1 hypothetical protein H8B22_04225 [Lysobacter terrestris]